MIERIGRARARSHSRARVRAPPPEEKKKRLRGNAVSCLAETSNKLNFNFKARTFFLLLIFLK